MHKLVPNKLKFQNVLNDFLKGTFKKSLNIKGLEE